MAIGAVLYSLLQIVMIGGARSGQHRERLVEAARHRSVGLRRLVHARARGRRRLAREGAAHRRGHLARRHRRRLRRHHRAPVVRARRGARDAERARDDEQQGRAGRVDPRRRRRRLLAFGPFKSWNALVSVVTGATAIMYAFAPVSLAALHKLDRRPAALVPRAGAEGSCCRRRSARRT